MLAPKVREVVLQILFALDNGGNEDVMPLIMREAKIASRHVKEAYKLAKEILSLATTYDQKIDSASKEYEINRIPTVEKNILRYALHEMKQGVDIPLIVSESVRLARKFSTPEAGAFVHGVLQTLTSLSSQEEGTTS